MKMNDGTPSTLKKAIENGLEEFNTGPATSHEELVEILRQHVEEFMNNKLAPVTLAADNPDVLKYVDKITKALK